MKRVVTMGVLALTLVALSGQRASAWCKFGFSAGVNVGWECADNNFLWGACRSGPAPYAQNGGGYGYGGGFGYAGAGMPAPDFATRDAMIPYATASAAPAPLPSAPAPSAPAPSAPVSTPRQAPVQQLSYPESDYSAVSYWNAPAYYYPGN